jgi:hypothetical protein
VANEYLENIRARKKNKKTKKPNIVFVGVHVRYVPRYRYGIFPSLRMTFLLAYRLTDAVEHMVKRYNLPPLNPSYYFAAIDLFRDKFKHVVFVLVSDEME